MLHRLLLLLFLAIFSATAIGCGKTEPRGDVSGEVTCDGQPIAGGMVSFESTTAVAPPRNVPIRDGKYCADGNNALPLGAYRVRITAPKPSSTGPNAPSGPREPIMYIPLLAAPWNTQSTLSVDIQAGKNVFHFRGKPNDAPTLEVGRE